MAGEHETELIDAETKAAFNAVDEDSDGKISHSELRACLRLLTGAKRIPEGIFNAVIEEADQDKSGWINYEEFSNALGTCTLLETVIRLFVQFDRDRDQYLSVAELRAAVSNLDAAPYDHDHVEKILNESDLNKDGRISFDEFAYHMMQEEEEHQH